MTLALYSNQRLSETKNITEQLFGMIDKEHPKIGYISSATDSKRIFYNSTMSYYNFFGGVLGPYNDLENSYSKLNIDALFDSDAIHLTGGNTYRFLSQLRNRSLDSRLIKYAEEGGTIIGVSAGAILLTPNIESTALCDDINEVGLTDLRGLNIFPTQVIPHAQEIEGLNEKAMTLVQKHKTSAYSLNDDEALFLSNSSIIKIGSPTYFQAT